MASVPTAADEARAEDRRLPREPRLATVDLPGVGLAVAAAGGLAREAPRHRGHVDGRAEGGLVDPARLLEPPEHRASRGPRERAPERPLARSGSLADEHHLAEDGRAVDDRADHLGARGAGVELAVQDRERGAACGGSFDCVRSRHGARASSRAAGPGQDRTARRAVARPRRGPRRARAGVPDGPRGRDARGGQAGERQGHARARAVVPRARRGAARRGASRGARRGAGGGAPVLRRGGSRRAGGGGRGGRRGGGAG